MAPPNKEEKARNLTTSSSAILSFFDIIKDYRIEVKHINYEKLKDSATGIEIVRKAREIQNLYENNEMAMEWEHIQQIAIQEIVDEKHIDTGMQTFSEWMRKEEKNFVALNKKLVDIAECQEFLIYHANINEDFKKRLEEEN